MRGFTVAGSGVTAGGSFSGRVSLPVAVVDVEGPHIVRPQEEVDSAGQTLHRWV